MRIVLMAVILLGAAWSCLAAAELLTIKTLDGQTYPNAMLEGVNPDGIDIGYVNEKGYYVLRGLEFKNLPPELQKKFGYNPAASKAFADQVKKHSTGELDDAVGAEKTRLARISQEIKAKFTGEDIKIKPEDLQYAVYARRLSVQLTPVATTRTGCVAEIKNVVSGGPVKFSKVLIDGQSLPANGDWSGFIYPTGLKTVYRKETIPVYAESLERAQSLLSYHLNIYGEYAAAKQQENATGDNTAPPDQNDPATDDPADPVPATNTDPAPAAPAATADSTATATTDSGATLAGSEYPYYFDNPYDYDHYDYGGGFYFIGGDYWPVHWWWHRHPHPPRPPHPYYGRTGVLPNMPGRGGLHPYSPIPGQGGRYVRPVAPQPSFRTPTHTISRHGGFRQAMPHAGGGHIGGGHMGGGHMGGFR